MRRIPRIATILTCCALFALAGAEGALAQTPGARPTVGSRPAALAERPLYGQLAGGVWVMVYLDQLFYVGERGVRSLCPDGDYRLMNGSQLPVLAAHIVPPWVKVGFNPQPEPPGRELFARATNGSRLVIAGGVLLLESRSGTRSRCHDGVWALRGGGTIQVVGGQILNPAHVVGFRP